MGCGSSTSRRRRNNSAANHVQYKEIDERARRAPTSLRNSVDDLVNYMKSYSEEHRILARGFYVWISKNIRYDEDGHSGRSEASDDALSVMREGRGVCAGYANVMKELCSKANIPVQIISGFSKGSRYPADKPVTLSDDTDHAWNAIELDGKWYLLDCTWGSGHREPGSYKQEFEDFYFLTDPKYFIFDHFPYMKGNLKDSQKKQWLSRPIGLQEFNDNVTCKPAAFKLGIQAVSHPNGYITMKNELRMRFKCTKKEDFALALC